MNTGKTIFAQVMEHLPLPEFRKCVQRYGGDYKAKTFSCLDQLLVMAFAHVLAVKRNIAIKDSDQN